MSQNQRVREAIASGAKSYIMSVFPQALTASRPFNGYTQYILPAATGDNVAACEVSNAFQYTYVGDGKWTDTPVFADDIARDLLNEFGSGMVGQDSGFGPGIWIQDSPEPAPETVARYRTIQENYFRHLVRQAESLFTAGKAHQITDLHRAAAGWLGANDYQWMERVDKRNTKECVACFSKIDSRATICPVCTSRQPDPNAETPESKPQVKQKKDFARELGEALK